MITTEVLMGYEVAGGETLAGLQIEVLELADEGYDLAGAMCVTMIPEDNIGGMVYRFFYFQPMAKYGILAEAEMSADNSSMMAEVVTGE